jgi:hypothetical protein
MSTVRITLSQDVIDKDHSAPLVSLLPGGDPTTMFDSLAKAAVAALYNSSEIVSWSSSGSTLLSTILVQYADGSTGRYYGGWLPAPGGTGNSTILSGMSYVHSRPGQPEISVVGSLAYEIVVNGSTLTVKPAGQGFVVREVHLDSKLPSGDANLDPTFGNVSLSMKGDLTLRQDRVLSGTLTRIEATADKFVSSAFFEGRFDATNLFGAAGRAALWGTTNSYQVLYQDGSRIDVSKAAIPIESANVMNNLALGGSTGDDDIAVDLPDRLYEDVYVTVRAGNDAVSLKGGGGRLHSTNWSGDDVITLLGGSHEVYGGSNIDTVKLSGNRADYTVKYIPPPPPRDVLDNPSGWFEVTDKSGAVNKLAGIERLVFANADVAIDIDGHGGQAYRLYEAALDRSPDLVGLGFWISVLDRGALSLHDVAAFFMTSKEYQDLYGSSQTHLELVTRLYQNIHGREPDAGGRDFWVGLLDRGVLDEAGVLVAISESAEHKAAMTDLIGNGFAYTPWQG